MAAHTLSKSELRDLCEWSFWEVCFRERCNGLFYVFPHPTPHYQIVDLESYSFRFLIFKEPVLIHLDMMYLLGRFRNLQP